MQISVRFFAGSSFLAQIRVGLKRRSGPKFVFTRPHEAVEIHHLMCENHQISGCGSEEGDNTFSLSQCK